MQIIGIKKRCQSLPKAQPRRPASHPKDMSILPEPIRCHLPGDSSLIPFASRTPGLRLCEPLAAEVLLVETPYPPGGVLLEKGTDGTAPRALAFLPRPYDYAAFMQALRKARSRQAPPPENAAYFFVKSEYRLVRIDIDRILYIEGMKNYAKIHLEGETRPILTLLSLKSLEERLRAPAFSRIHRSYIVHLRYVRSLERGHAVVGSVRIPIADKHRHTLVSLVGAH